MISRAALDDEYDTAVFESRWRHVFVAGDPFFHPHLSKHHDDFAPDHEPTQLSLTGGPTLPPEATPPIPVVKLDPLGPGTIPFPAVSRLQPAFPNPRDSGATRLASPPA